MVFGGFMSLPVNKLHQPTMGLDPPALNIPHQMRVNVGCCGGKLPQPIQRGFLPALIFSSWLYRRFHLVREFLGFRIGRRTQRV